MGRNASSIVTLQSACRRCRESKRNKTIYFAPQRRYTRSSVCRIPNRDVFNRIRLNTATRTSTDDGCFLALVLGMVCQRPFWIQFLAPLRWEVTPLPLGAQSPPHASKREHLLRESIFRSRQASMMQ